MTEGETMLGAARVLAKQGYFAKAVTFYQEACRRLPDRADAQREMAVLLLNQTQVARFPWEKKRLAREAACAAGRAQELGNTNGDCWFVAAEGAGMMNRSIDKIPAVLVEGLNYYEQQIARGEQVSALYLGTALRLAQINEANGLWAAAIELYEVMAGATELERQGKVRPGSSTPGQIEQARRDIARLQAQIKK